MAQLLAPLESEVVITPATARDMTMTSFTSLMALFNVHTASLQKPGTVLEWRARCRGGPQLLDVLLQVSCTDHEGTCWSPAAMPPG